MTNLIILQGYSYPSTALANVLATEAYEGRTVRIAIQHAGGWTVSPETPYSDYDEPWSKDFLDLKITPDEKASVCSCRERVGDDESCPVHGKPRLTCLTNSGKCDKMGARLELNKMLSPGAIPKTDKDHSFGGAGGRAHFVCSCIPALETAPPKQWFFLWKGDKMNLTQEELAKLESCKTRAEWVATCDEIKAVRNDIYPPDWWAKVKLTGMIARIAARWGSDDKIHTTQAPGVPMFVSPD